MSIEVIVLASGSSGNSVFVRGGGVSVLIDAGVSCLQIRNRLHYFGHVIDDLAAVMITHEHSDHIRGLDVLSRRHPTAVWASQGTWTRLPVRSECGGELNTGRELRLEGLTVLPVATSHDAVEPIGFVIDDGQTRIGVCTDTGVVTQLMERRFAGVDVLLIETNHDADMLRHGPYPWSLKQRIASRHGHLGNHQTEEAVCRLAGNGLRCAVGLHLSAENNAADLAEGALRRAVDEAVPVDVVTRSEMLRIVLDGNEMVIDKQVVPVK